MSLIRTIAAGMLCLLSLQFSMSTSASEADNVGALLDGFHDAASRSDFNDYFSRFSDDAYFLGTDASERWSVAEFKVYAGPAFKAGKGWTYEVLTRNLELVSTDSIFWFDEILMNTGLGRCRGTGVVIKQNGVWKIAHYSLTLLIPNDIAHDVGKQSLQADALVE
jgi:ketosteroid isomerase-like protein